MGNIGDLQVVILFLVSCNICTVTVVRFSLLLSTRTNFLARNFHICTGLSMVSVSTVTAGLLQNVVENNNAENLDVMVSFVRFVQNLEKKMVKKNINTG